MGIEVAYSPKGYFLSQSKYIANILEQTRLFDTRAADSPRELNDKYVASDGDPLPNPTLYHTLIDRLVYLTITIPNIIYVVHVVSQFFVSPTIVHWTIVLRICCFIFEEPNFRAFSFPHCPHWTTCLF